MGKRDFIIKYFPFASLYAFEPLLYSTKYAYTSLFIIKGAHQGGPNVLPIFSARPTLKVKSASKIELKTQSTHPERQVFPSTQPKNQVVSN